LNVTKTRPTSANPLRLIRLHLELKCIGFDSGGRLVRIPGSDPDDVPRVYVARHGDTYTTYYGAELSRSV